MADQRGELTELEKKILLAWLDRQQVRGACPACGNGHFSLGDTLVHAPTFTPGGMTLGGPTVPLFFRVCGRCGHLQFFAAVPTGVLSAQRSPEVAEEEAEPSIGQGGDGG